ncbi:MAG: MraY family glycosyltransferase [Chloroherpetonaceae bacterium]
MFVFTLFVAPLFVALLAVVLLTPLVRWASIRFRVEDASTEARKIHKGTIPTLGGIAIFFGAMAAFLVGYWVSPEFAQLVDRGLWAVLLGATLICLTGMLDDAVNLNFKTKFAIQTAIAVFTVVFGEHRITEILNPFGANLELSEQLSSLLTVVWIIGICNAVNLIDGLDGLAAGVVGIGAATMSVISGLYGDVALALGYGAISCATLGFLRYNFNPATIFMGDTGALFIGYLMACLPLFHAPSATDGIIWIQVLILGFPIADTLLAPVRRMLSGTHPFKADREHIHHRLMFFIGLSHKHTVLRIYSISIVLCVAALLTVFVMQSFGAHGAVAIYVILSAMLALGAVGLRRLGYFTAMVRRPTAKHLKPQLRRAKDALLERDITPKPFFRREVASPQS